MLALVLAMIQAAVGAYLGHDARRREQHDRDGVLCVGHFLLVCAALLLALELLLVDGRIRTTVGRCGHGCYGAGVGVGFGSNCSWKSSATGWMRRSTTLK